MSYLTVRERIENAMELGWEESFKNNLSVADRMVKAGVLELVKVARGEGVISAEIQVTDNVLEFLRSSKTYSERFFELLLDVVPVDLYLFRKIVGHYRLGTSCKPPDLRWDKGQPGRLEYKFPVISYSNGQVKLNFKTQSTPVKQAFVHMASAIGQVVKPGSRTLEVFNSVVQLTRHYADPVCACSDPVKFYADIFTGSDPVLSYFDSLPTGNPE